MGHSMGVWGSKLYGVNMFVIATSPCRGFGSDSMCNYGY